MKFELLITAEEAKRIDGREIILPKVMMEELLEAIKHATGRTPDTSNLEHHSNGTVSLWVTPFSYSRLMTYGSTMKGMRNVINWLKMEKGV